MESTNCNLLLPLKREAIFGNKEYDPATKNIYNACGNTPIGTVKQGKILWFKNKDVAPARDSEGPNRQKRRERFIKRNMVVQVVPIFDTKGTFTGSKEVLHKKITNLPVITAMKQLTFTASGTTNIYNSNMQLPENKPEVKLADVLTDTQIAAMGNYGRYLQKKHPTWSREKIAKKSAALYNIKLV